MQPQPGDLLIKQFKGEVPPGWILFGDYEGMFRMCWRTVTADDGPVTYKVLSRAFIVEGGE